MGPAIDTFAFGAILHRMWTGALPETDAPYLYEAALEKQPDSNIEPTAARL